MTTLRQTSFGGYMSKAIISQTFVKDALLKWQVAHEMNVRLEDENLIVSDGTQYNWHLLRLNDSEFLYRLVRIKCLLRRLETSTVNFYVHHFGSVDVAEIALDGTVINKGISRFLYVEKRGKDLLEVELEFLNCHPTISIGCSKDCHPVYAGTGREQFSISRIEIETRDATAELCRIPEEQRIRLIDVGGAEGLQLKWMLRADRITPVIFEPIRPEAEAVRKTISRIPGAQVIENALAHTAGTRKLHVAAAAGCSSLREPNFSVLNRYSIGNIFKTVAEREVLCTRYDELFRKRIVPAPDAIKIDVQGFEYEVLLGFGHLLETCLGIELESQFYPLYRDQKLLSDIVAYLDQFGFALRALRQLPNFDGEFVECDAFFTKRRHEISDLPETVRKKFATLTEAWELTPYF